MSKAGRKPQNPENPIVEVISAKISKEDINKLDYCTEKLGISKSAVIRKGIDQVYSEAKRMK